MVRKMDAKSAYLQGDAITRELYLRLPVGRIPGVDLPPTRAKIPIHGTGDATRKWKKVSKCLSENDWVASTIEPALFYLWHGKGLVGMCTMHVDDLLCAGERAHD